MFESVGAVWHKEILLALQDGIAVYGASSMGAIRAAELAPFGMVGVGAIYEAYCDGRYTDDDEVALLQGPATFGYPAMSEAMVNIRATVARALHAHGFATQPTSRHRGDGFRLLDAYITAALHCVPPDNRPTRAELRRCARYLHAELPRLRRVRVVVGLGKIGFDAYLSAAGAVGFPVPRPRPRFAHGAAFDLPWGVALLGSYHPSRQNTQTGKLTWAMFEAVFAEARRRLGAADQPEAGRPVTASQSPAMTSAPPATVKGERASPSHATPRSAPTSGCTLR